MWWTDGDLSSFTLKLFLTLIPTRKTTYGNLMVSSECVRWFGHCMTIWALPVCNSKEAKKYVVPKTPLVKLYNWISLSGPAWHHFTQADALSDVEDQQQPAPLPHKSILLQKSKKITHNILFQYLPSHWRPVQRALKPRTDPLNPPAHAFPQAISFRNKDLAAKNLSLRPTSSADHSA